MVRWRDQVVAEREHHLPVLARIGVGDRGDLVRRDRPARLGQQRRVQRALGGAGLGRRHQLRPRQIDLEEFVGRNEPAARVAIEQMVAAGEPEVLHCDALRLTVACRVASAARSTCSAGSSSPSTSRNANARSGFGPPCAAQACGTPRGSRRPRACDAPRSACRADESQSELANATSSSAAAARVVDDRARRNAATSCCASSSTTACAIVLARLDDLHQRRPAERCDAEKPARNAARALPSQRRRIVVPEHEGAGHRPFAGLRRMLEHEGVGRIEPDGAQQFHSRGPRVAGSSQDGVGERRHAASAARPRPCPMRRTSRSPLSSMSRRTPVSGASRAR